MHYTWLNLRNFPQLLFALHSAILANSLFNLSTFLLTLSHFYLIKSAHFYIFAKFLIFIISIFNGIVVFLALLQQRKLRVNDIFEYVVTPKLSHKHKHRFIAGGHYTHEFALKSCFRCLLMWVAVSHVSSCQSAWLYAMVWVYLCECVVQHGEEGLSLLLVSFL